MENLEKNIKDKLQQSKIEIDTNKLWNEVYPYIKPERRKRLFVYLLFGFVWLLSLIAVGWHFSASSQDDSHSTSINKIVESQNHLEESKESIEKSKIVNTTSLGNEIENRKLSESKFPLSFDQNNGSETIVNTKSIRKGAVNKESKVDIQRSINNIPSRSANIFSPASKLNTNNVNDEDLNLNTTSIVKDVIETIDLNNTIKIEPKTVNKIEALSTKRLNFSNRKLNKTELSLGYNIPQPVIPLSMYSEYVYDSEYTAFSFYAFGGYSSIDKVLTANDNILTNNLMDRTTSESPLESISGEMGFSYMITPNFQLSAGVNYIRINERVENSYSVTDTVLLENVIIENIISSRGSEPVYGNIQSQRTINTDLRAYNRYSDLALSVDLTYLLSGEALRPYLSLGLQQSVSSTNSGYWLLDNDNLYDISEDQNDYLSNNYGLALRFGAGVDLEISERTSIRVGGRYTKYINAITNKNYELIQKYNLLGLSAGMNIKI